MTQVLEAADKPPRVLHVALWVAQALLGAMFAFAGGTKLFASTAEMAAKAGLSPALITFIGVAEVAGAIGVVLPAATRVRPMLTPLAALGLAVVMVLATAFHVSRGEFTHLAAPLVLLALAVFVAWGRSRKAPIAPR